MAKQKRHYDQEALLAEYTSTFNVFLKAMVLGIGGVVLFFLVFIVYLGGWSHTPHKEFYETFKDRFTIEYEGKKLPYYEE